jgi:hypothetical protein
VRIRWQWITLPATLVVFALVFLVTTIWKNSKERSIGVWKTSALAILFNGLGEDVQGAVSAADKQSDVRTKARGMQVKLEED